jgi:hypothetical protein
VVGSCTIIMHYVANFAQIMRTRLLHKDSELCSFVIAGDVGRTSRGFSKHE